MTSNSKKNITRLGFIAGITVALLAFEVHSAMAVPSSVKSACKSDYFSYCSQYRPGSAGLSRCMRRNGSRLSRRCVKALVKTGYVSKRDISRRAAKR